MNLGAKDIVRALLELSRAMPDGDAFLKKVRDELDRHVDAEVVTATLTTPTGAAGPLAEEVKATLEQKLGRPVALIERADTALIGGAVVQYGDQQIDLSLRGSLQQFSSSHGH